MTARTSSAATPQEALVERLADHVAQLELWPRDRRWTSLSACVLDAVWSVGSHYDRVVWPLVRRVLEPDADGPLVAAALPAQDTYPLTRLLDRFPDEAALLGAAGNRQRTSTRGGVTKADAALRYARILVDHEVTALPAVSRLLGTSGPLAEVDRVLSRVPGEGRHGIRRRYFWMLCGDEERIKPDRMVMRWLAPHGVRDPAAAQQVLSEVAALLSNRAGARAPRVTPWQVDHAIWLAARQPDPA